MSLIKVTWYVLRVKNMHFGSLLDALGSMRRGKAELNKLQYHAFEPRILQFNPVFHHLPSVGPKQLCALVHLGCTPQRVLSSDYCFVTAMLNC